MHISIIAILCFVIGMALHLLAQVDAIARAPNHPANSRLQIVKDRVIPIIVRDTLCLAFFIGWLQGQLADYLMAAGVQLPETVKHILDIHVGGVVALFAGFAFDSCLGYIPALKSSIPPPIDSPETK